MKTFCVMHRSSNRRNKHSPENFIDRVISRFRMAKRGSQGTTNVSQAEAPDKQSPNDQKPIAFGNHKYDEETDVGENPRVSLQDLPVFCDQLERFIKYVRNVRDLQFLTYDYPRVVQNRFDNDVLELESMLKEINASLTNIHKQKAQTSFVEKEKTAIKKTLNRLKDDEFREMENVVALYDKALFLRWQSVKMTHKPQLFKSLLTDIKCKQLALENLETLVTRKLGNLKAFPSLTGNGHDKIEKSIIPLPFPPICPAPNERKSRIPQPPLLPPPPTLASINKAQSSSVQIRRRLEREEENISENNVYFAASDIDAIDLPVILPTFNNVPDNLIISPNENSHREVLSASYFTSTGSQGELTAGLQEEMRTVLQVSIDIKGVIWRYEKSKLSLEPSRHVKKISYSPSL